MENTGDKSLNSQNKEKIKEKNKTKHKDNVKYFYISLIVICGIFFTGTYVKVLPSAFGNFICWLGGCEENVRDL